MARVQGMTPEGIRKLIAASVAFIKDLNVEDLNKLLAAFEDANGIFDVRLVEAQEAVKAAGAKALEAEEQAGLIIDELAKYEQAQAEEAARILGEVAVAIDAANLASAKVPDLLARLELAERSVSTANTEVEKFITKQDEFLAISQEQVSRVGELNSGFQELNQAVDESITKVDEANANLGLVSADLDAAKASLDAKMKQNELNISAAQEAADSNQNAISDLNEDLSGLSTKHEKLTSSFSAEVEKLEKADASLLTNMNTKVGDLNATTAAQATAISAAKTQADKGVSDAAAASFALANYKTVNDPKVSQALKDADKGIEDAAAALTKANTAAGQLPAMNTAISSAAAAAKKANDALPTIRTDISNVSTRISTATGNLSSLESDVASKVAALQAMDQSQAGEISTTNSKIDNLQIGGRNLARRRKLSGNSAYQTVVDTGEKFWTGEPIYYGEKLTSGTPPTSLHGNIRIEPGETYTISMWVRGETDSGQTNANILFYDARALKSLASTPTGAPASEWHLISATVHNDTDTAYESVALYFYINRNPGEKTWFTSPKLERGNKATDWTPAPEDVADDVAKAQLEAETARAEAESKSQAAQTAAELYAKEKSEADIAASLVASAAEALRVAKLQADAAKAAAATDAKAKADEAERLAKIHADAQAKAAKETAEANAALDATNKANKAKTDAEAKAATLATAAKDAAATALSTYKGVNDPKVVKAQSDATAAKNAAAAAQRAADQAALDATNKSNVAREAAEEYAREAAEAAQAQALETAAAEALRIAQLEAAAAKAAAATDAKNKADEAERLAKLYAEAQAKTAKEQAEANAAADASTKANKAKADAQAAAKVLSDKAQQAAVAAQSSIDNLEIGGRNYFLNSGGVEAPVLIHTNNGRIHPITRGTDEHGAWIQGTNTETSEWSLSTYMNPLFESGYGSEYSPDFQTVKAPYTQSVELMCEVPVRAGLHRGESVDLEPGVWTRVYRTTTDNAQTRPGGILADAIGDTPIDTRLYHRRWKLEAGTRATDWSPAPEDVDADIAKAQLEAEIARAEAESKSNAARVAAELAAKEMADQAQADAEVEAARAALVIAQKEAKAAKDAAAVDATQKANAARTAAETLAKAEAKSAKETAEANAAIDATTKANKAKTDAEAKAATLATAAKDAAATALTGYKNLNDPKVAAAKSAGDKGIADAKAAAAAAKKANDALPALSSGISTLTRDLATASGNLSGLESSVSSKISALVAMDTAQAGEISTAKSQAAQGISDAATAQSTVDNLQIGGRNLLQNSKLNLTMSNYNMIVGTYGQTLRLPKDNPLVNGEEVTVSIKGQLGEDRRAFALYNSGGTYNIVQLSQEHQGDDGVYRRTTTWKGAETSNSYIYIYQMNSGAETESTIEWVKIERGNKATDWTPAPEDIDSGIITAQSTADTARTEAETKANQALQDATTALGSYQKVNDPKVTAAKNAADTAKARADKGVTDAATAKSAADTAQQRADKGVNDAATAKQVAEKVGTDLENLEIGGRNLYQNSLDISLGGTDMKTRVTHTQIPGGSRIEVAEGGSWNAYKFVESHITDPEFFNRPGAQYTMSYDIRTGPLPEGYEIRARFDTRSPGSAVYAETFETTGDTGEKWVRLRATMVMPNREPQRTSLLNMGPVAGPGVPAEGIWVEVRNFKLERGNKATDWTPAPEDTQAEIDALVTTAGELTTGLSQAATQKQYNDLNTRLWGGQGEINTLQGEINANNSAFQTWQTEVNGRRDAWEKASTNATKALGELAIEQGKVLDIQTELSKKRERWENGATLAINNLTNFSTRQDKWNLASSNATKALADLTTEQGKVLALQKELNTKRDRWENGATLAIDNLTNFSTRQDKWNKASSNATKALEDAGKAQLSATSANTTALQGLTAASMLAFPHLNITPHDSSDRPWWSIGMGVNTTLTPPGFPSGPSYYTASSSISNVNPEALITVVPGIDYKLEFWAARVDAGTAGAYTDVRDEAGKTALTHWADVTGGVPTEINWSARNYAGGALSTSTAWVRKVYLLRVRSGTEKMALHFRPGSTATNNGTRVRFWGAHLSAFMPIQEQIDATQTAALASHAALFEGQNKWNDVATSAIQAQATLLANQTRWSDGVNKALAWQDQLNNSQSDINKTTKSVLDNQGKWNSAQAEINNKQSDTNKAVKLVLDNQEKWNLAQAEINNEQSVTNKAVKLVNDNQTKWNTAVTNALKAHDELFVSTTKTFKAVKAVTDNQSKWNKVVSDLVTTNTAVSNANKTAIEGLNRVLGLTHSSSNIVPMVPGGVRTGGTDIAPVFTPTPGWMTKGTRVTVTDIPGISSIDAIQQSVQATQQFTPYYSEIDPTIEYKYSYWAKANVASTRMYIEVRSPETGTLAVANNTPDGHSSSGAYLAGNVLLAIGWKKYTGTIKFSPDVRSIWIHRVYYNHPNGVVGTQTLADIQIYPNMPSQTDVNKALSDSDAAQNTLLAKQEDWNDAASRSIATAESLWGETNEDVGELNILTEELGEKIQQQSDDFAKNITQLFTFIPRIAYAMDGQDVAASETDGFVKITRTKSGSRTTKVAVEAVGRWVGTMIVEGDHGQSTGQDKTFMNLTPIRLKLAVNSATRIFYLNRSTSVDHIGAVKVTFLVDPGQVVVLYPKGTNFTPDKSAWTTLHTQEITAAESTEHNLSLSVTFSGTTREDTYGVRIRVGNSVVAELKKSKIGPLFPGQNGTRVMGVQKAQVHIPAGTRIYFEAYSTGRDYPIRRVSKWSSQISYITSGRA